MTVSEADKYLIEAAVSKLTPNHPLIPWSIVTTLSGIILDPDTPKTKLTKATVSNILKKNNVLFETPQLPSIIDYTQKVIKSATHG